MSDPELLAWRCAEAMLADDEASRAAGVTIDDVGPGRATVCMRVGETMINGHSLCHGGYVFLLADTAFALACAAASLSVSMTLGQLPTRPWARAAASPAIVRWWIMARSGSANAAMTVKKNLPSPVAVYVPASVPGQDA